MHLKFLCFVFYLIVCLSICLFPYFLQSLSYFFCFNSFCCVFDRTVCLPFLSLVLFPRFHFLLSVYQSFSHIASISVVLCLLFHRFSLFSVQLILSPVFLSIFPSVLPLLILFSFLSMSRCFNFFAMLVIASSASVYYLSLFFSYVSFSFSCFSSIMLL